MLSYCPVCNGTSFTEQDILWDKLISDWDLSQTEVEYVNKQQGFSCDNCGNNLRSMALAMALLKMHGSTYSLNEWVKHSRNKHLKVLEINPAGCLTKTLEQMPHHKLVEYPEYDLMDLKIPSSEYDLVIHSDTLEHIKDPIQALKECYRVTKPGGLCIYTVPIIVDRLTRSREGMENSFHGSQTTKSGDYIVRYEFGADYWTFPIRSGFSSITTCALEYPAALAIVGKKANTMNEEVEFTGERFIPSKRGAIEFEHLHRYHLAKALVKDKKVLDVACGEGYGSNILAELAETVTGVDICEITISNAKTNYTKNNLEFHSGNMSDIPMADSSVDIVISFETIEHGDKHEEFMKEIKRVLKPEGFLIISSPDKLEYTDIPSFSNSYHVKELYLDDFKVLLSKYFKNTQILGQRVVYGSLIVNESKPSHFDNFILKNSSIEKDSKLLHPIYDIAICSDTEIAPMPSSFWEQNNAEDPLNQIDELNNKINDLNNKTNELSAMLAKEKNILQEMLSSTCWKITWPIRKFKELFS